MITSTNDPIHKEISELFEEQTIDEFKWVEISEQTEVLRSDFTSLQEQFKTSLKKFCKTYGFIEGIF